MFPNPSMNTLSQFQRFQTSEQSAPSVQNVKQEPQAFNNTFGSPGSGMIQQNQRRSPQDNEYDLLHGNIMQELGIDPHMIVKKTMAALPFMFVPSEVAAYPEMVFGLFVMGLAFLISKMRKYIPVMFGSLLAGSLYFKILVSMLVTAEINITFYDTMSAICYSLFPIMLTWLVVGYTNCTPMMFFIVTIPAAIYASYILQKFLDAIVNIKNVRMLIVFPAFIYNGFWLLFGRGLIG